LINLTLKRRVRIPSKRFFISGKSINSILSLIERTSSQIIKLFIKMRLKKAKDWRNHFKARLFWEKFKIALQIPSSYELMVQDSSFVCQKEIISGNTSVLIYKFLCRLLTKKIVLSLISLKCDSIGVFIFMVKSNTDMIYWGICALLL
jgi:hypothetical protein